MLSNFAPLHALPPFHSLKRRHFLVMQGISPLNVYLTLEIVAGCVGRVVRLRVYIFLRWML